MAGRLCAWTTSTLVLERMQQIALRARRSGVCFEETGETILKGEPAASWDVLADVYRREQPGLVRLATLLVRDRAVAEELVQEAFVRVHPKLGTVDQPGGYLRTTVVNLCRGHGRRISTADRHGPRAPEVVPPPSLPDDLSPVWLALGDLPDRQRDALVLRFYLDLPDDEIARLLGARPGTVRSLISRGLAALKEVVSP